MMKRSRIITLSILAFLALIILIGALELGFGWFGVYKTRTIGKAQQNADREVFEETQSYVEAKRQEAIKYRLEYMRCTDSLEKEAIKQTCIMAFSNFDENKLLEPELRNFVYEMKYSD